MKSSIIALITAFFATVSAAPAPGTNAQCVAGFSFCDEPSGYGRSFYVCDARHTTRAFSCKAGSACCNTPEGISCGMPGTCEPMEA
ncbi:hypothetical protein FKW77_005670 [Venturia effusa]|uniref:Chitin-binding type-2 domain-containing protein n=1 Tax=Venturia effusa TaxID=50376 RepID=A0A517KZH9_9PEZI|nr:hypothetical protein FKW77_005670 [Venturia effusa]